MPELYKIGWSRKDPESRISKLYTTGVPTPFEIEYKKLVNDAPSIENKIHKLLHEYRVSNKREFFKFSQKDEIINFMKIEVETETDIEIEDKSIPNYKNKSFINYINKYFEKSEIDILNFIEKLTLNDCYMDDERLDYNFRYKNYGTFDSFRTYASSQLKFIKNQIYYLANNWDDIIKDIGIILLMNDNKYVERQINDLNKEMNTYKNQLSLVL
jgi:hypothetical protein